MTTSAGLEPLIGAAWLTTRLTTDSLLATALGLAGTADLAHRVHGENVPLNSADPFVYFNLQSPGEDTQGVNAAIIFTQPLYTVRVSRQTTDALELAEAAGRVHQLLHQQGGPITLGTMLAGYVRCARERPFYQEYNDENGYPWRALGGVYRLYIDV